MSVTVSPVGHPIPSYAPQNIENFLGQPRPEVMEVLARVPGPFLVLGAGGKMGLHLCTMLRQALMALGRHDRLLAVSRFSSLHNREIFETCGITTLGCDLSDPTSVADLPDAGTVFFLAGVKFDTAAAPGLLQAGNIQIPQLIASRFSRSRIVAFSTGCVYPFVPVTSGGATEATPLEPVGAYAASCMVRERIFSESSVKHGTAVTLVRLNYSVEFRYGVLVDIAERVLLDKPIDVTMGHVNVIWQTDAIAHAIQALDLAGAPATPLNVAGPDILSVRDIAHRFGKFFGRPAKICGNEAATAWLNNASYSHRLFGRPQISVDDMIRWTAEWLVSGRTTWNKPTGFDRRDGRF